MQERKIGLLNGQRAVARPFVMEQLQLFREIHRQMIADEGEVVVFAHDLARVFDAAFFDDFLPDGKAQVIRVRGERDVFAARGGADDVGVTLDRIHVSGLGQEVRLA